MLCGDILDIVKNMRLSTQFIAVALVALLSMTCLAALSAFALKESLLEERKLLTKSAVEIVQHTISKGAVRALEAGESEETAKANLIELIESLRFNDNEYFFVIDTSGVVITTAVSGHIGTNRLQSQDAKGKFHVKELIRTSGINGGGFTSYYFSRPGSDVPLSKISYITRYEPWNWVLGTGLYVDDIDALFYQRLMISAVFLILSVLLMLALVAIAVRQHKISMNMIFEQIRQLGDTDAAKVSASSDELPRNEFGSILRAVYKARDTMLEHMNTQQKSETNRIRQVLDQASSPLCLTDSDRRIIYANVAARELLASMQPELKQHCPQFNDNEITSLKLEHLHPDPVNFITRLNQEPHSVREQLQIGNFHLMNVTTRLLDANGNDEGSGFVAECLNITEQLKRNQIIEEQAQSEREKNDSIRERVDHVLETVNAASKGDLRGNIAVSGDDAVGVMSSSLSSFIEELRVNFKVIGTHVSSIADATGSLSATANEFGRNADSTATQADTASSSAANINTAVESVASAATQMSSSIQGIADNTNTAANVAQAAVELAGSTDQSMRQLSDSSNKIGQVVKVINTIAEQTNLLALNATIEAARAGEAGKGFAVVAGEVKELAKETAKATEDIQAIIESIQSDTESAVTANSTILDTVSQIHTIQKQISSAVDEQMSTTRSITEAVQAAAAGCGDVVNNVSKTAKTADEARSKAKQSRDAIEHLTDLTSQLNGLLASYKVN